jgi:hypothetical protein
MGRVALNEEEITNVVGGFIEYKYSSSRGYGLAWINQKDDPAAANIRYKFTDFDAFKERFGQLYSKYGDYGILQALEKEGLCHRV